MSSALSDLRNLGFETKEELRRAVLLLDLTNQQAQVLIGHLGNVTVRQELLAHSSIIADLLEIARHEISRI